MKGRRKKGRGVEGDRLNWGCVWIVVASTVFTFLGARSG